MPGLNHNDRVTESISYANQQTLALFAELGSFANVGRELNLSAHAVAERLRMLDNAWHAKNDTRLIQRKAGSKSWELTEDGRSLAGEFATIVHSTQLALSLVENQRRIAIDCTRSCLTDFAVLSRAVELDDTRTSIQPVSCRSAEIGPRTATRAHGHESLSSFALFSSLRNLKDDPVKLVEPTDHGEVQRLDVRYERLGMLLSARLDALLPSGPVRPISVLTADPDAVIMSPPGGVAWDYLENELPRQWHTLRPNNLFTIIDLDFGLQSFLTGALGRRNTAMVVHGWSEDEVARRQLSDRVVFREVDLTTHDWAAVISLFWYVGHPTTRSKYHERVWHVAQTDPWAGMTLFPVITRHKDPSDNNTVHQLRSAG